MINEKRRLSEDQKTKISKAMMGKNKGKTPWNAGKKTDEATKLKLSKALTGRPKSEATKEKMAKAKRGRKLSEETKAKMAEARRLYWKQRHAEDEKLLNDKKLLAIKKD